jgi:hypothetical protein
MTLLEKKNTKFIKNVDDDALFLVDDNGDENLLNEYLSMFFVIK